MVDFAEKSICKTSDTTPYLIIPFLLDSRCYQENKCVPLYSKKYVSYLLKSKKEDFATLRPTGQNSEFFESKSNKYERENVIPFNNHSNMSFTISTNRFFA